MTNTKNIVKKRDYSFIAPFACILLITLSLFYEKELKGAIINGMNLAALRIVPTLFPFMIISDFGFQA